MIHNSYPECSFFLSFYDILTRSLIDRTGIALTSLGRNLPSDTKIRFFFSFSLLR